MSGGVVVVGALYEDAGGIRYSVFDVGRDVEERFVVIYMRNGTGEIHVMPIEEWCAELDGVPRFRLVEGD